MGWRKKIIAIDQRVEVRRPRDKALRRWMTSISSLVTWNNEQCWGGTNGRRRIYGRLLLLSPSDQVMSCGTISLLFSCLHLCPTSPEGSVWAVRWWVLERQEAAHLLPQASWSHLETHNAINQNWMHYMCTSRSTAHDIPLNTLELMLHLSRFYIEFAVAAAWSVWFFSWMRLLLQLLSSTFTPQWPTNANNLLLDKETFYMCSSEKPHG